MTKKKTPPAKKPIDAYARPFLRKVIEQCASDSREPCDYFLVVGKYDPTSCMVVPRVFTDEILDIARTPARREKMEKLLAEPCGLKQLLVMLTAGDHIEGGFVHVPTIVPATPPQVAWSPTEREKQNEYIQRHAGAMIAHIEAEDGKPCDYVAIGRFPTEPPMVVRREVAREHMPISDYGDVVKALDVPAANDDELLFVYIMRRIPSSAKLQLGPKRGADND